MGKNESLFQRRELFWQLVKKEHDRARAYCFKLMGGSDEGDDLYQEAVVKAYNGYDGLKETESFRPWLYRIINNAYKERFRSPWWKRAKTMTAKMLDSVKSENPTEFYESKRRLNYALDCLSPEDRIIVTLAKLEGWKISELAELFSKTEGYIKMRLLRARNKMRKRLSSLYSKKSANNLKGESEIYAVLSGSKKAE